jgi:hypothetical protein
MDHAQHLPSARAYLSFLNVVLGLCLRFEQKYQHVTRPYSGTIRDTGNELQGDPESVTVNYLSTHILQESK